MASRRCACDETRPAARRQVDEPEAEAGDWKSFMAEDGFEMDEEGEPILNFDLGTQADGDDED